MPNVRRMTDSSLRNCPRPRACEMNHGFARDSHAPTAKCSGRNAGHDQDHISDRLVENGIGEAGRPESVFLLVERQAKRLTPKRGAVSRRSVTNSDHSPTLRYAAS